MQEVSLAGILVAVVAVFAAYFMGYRNGITHGRDKGYNDGKRDGSLEGSMQAFAAGFDHGKRAHDDDDDGDGNAEGEGKGAKSQSGWALLAAAAGILAVVWITSQRSTTRTSPASVPQSVPSAKLPRVEPPAALNRTPDSQQAPRDRHVPPTETVILPRINRTLPTASPVPTDSPPAEIDPGDVEFPHPPPGFGQRN